MRSYFNSENVQYLNLSQDETIYHNFEMRISNVRDNQLQDQHLIILKILKDPALSLKQEPSTIPSISTFRWE